LPAHRKTLLRPRHDAQELAATPEPQQRDDRDQRHAPSHCQVDDRNDADHR
jgi:hypothetical protein